MAGSVGGAFTGLYQGSSGAADAAAALRPLLPNISTYQQGPSTAPALQAQITTPAPASTGGGSNLSKFGHFIGGVAGEVGKMSEGAASWLAHTAIDMTTAPVKLGSGISHGILDRNDLASIKARGDQNTAKLQELTNEFKAGRLTASSYSSALKELNQDNANLQKMTASVSGRVTLDQKATTKALIDTASDLLLALTAGGSSTIDLSAEGLSVGSATSRPAAQWLASSVAKPMLDPVANTIGGLAENSKLFGALDHITQNVLQKATAEVVASGANLTAGQMARATAVNIALKYPIYFDYLSGTANKVYEQLDQEKYGDAIRTLAFNGLLVLSGGPIGHALKYGGDALKGVSEHTFGQTSFWDELSKYYGNQAADGFTKAVSDAANAIEDPALRKEFIKNLAAVEATNVAATGGDAVAAAARLAKGEQAKSLLGLGEISHAQAVEEMVGMAKNFRLANDAARKAGLGQIAVGRFDARSRGIIADAVTQADDTAGRLKAWEQLKAANPNDALANNPNLDRQITQAITTHEDVSVLRDYIMKINAQTTIEGLPKSLLDRMAKEGYVPIRPAKLEAPFKEGAGKLVTAHSSSNDFFVKAVQPLPVLGSIGKLFTHMGLSPNASSQRVYEMLNDNLARNLSGTKAFRSLVPTTDALSQSTREEADLIIKRLSNFSKETKLPITDLRMLTSKQISKALEISVSDAKEVQVAIARAHVDVSLAVKGLGDRAVDWSYNLHATAPVMRQYLKLQGAFRFSFNPFFQYLRVIPKTEILTESEGGGFLRSIFAGRAGQIKEIRGSLRELGAFDTPGHITSGDLSQADEAIVTTTKNISKHLLPMQERSIAGLVDAQAQRMGMDAKEYITQYPDQVRDTVQMIAQYDRNANFINSPMARTLNIAIFPFRFDTKVATIMARNLGKASLLTQVSFINGLMKAHDFLNSPQGQAWYAENSEVIGLFKYITPFASLSEAMQSLLPGQDHHLGNFGQLGGLPFGWIPALLDAEGLTHFNQPGVNPKTGDPFPHYIPKTTKGQAATAISDLLSMLFSYPGAEVGLQSKGGITRYVASSLTGAKSGDYTKTTPGLDGEQQQYKDNITPPTPTTSQQSQPAGTTQVAPTSTAPNLSAQAAAKTKPRALKKSDIRPVPAPGQSALGVL